MPKLQKYLVYLTLAIACSGLGYGIAQYLAPTQNSAQNTNCKAPEDLPAMVYIPAGEVLLGDANGYPEERNRKRVEINAFYMDTHEVTNAQFAEFVKATNYKTLAERALDPKDFPGIDASKLVPGSAVFQMPKSNKPIASMSWWRFIEGAYWKNPTGDNHNHINPQSPVVHIAYEDALAYAQWKGHDLPTEAE
ncbi:MAG: SUMF1/EgtB/PvdO family nonheme iron enzyme, partial [Parvibaculales bacterium]